MKMKSMEHRKQYADRIRMNGARGDAMNAWHCVVRFGKGF